MTSRSCRRSASRCMSTSARRPHESMNRTSRRSTTRASGCWASAELAAERTPSAVDMSISPSSTTVVRSRSSTTRMSSISPPTSTRLCRLAAPTPGAPTICFRGAPRGTWSACRPPGRTLGSITSRSKTPRDVCRAANRAGDTPAKLARPLQPRQPKFPARARHLDRPRRRRPRLDRPGRRRPDRGDLRRSLAAGTSRGRRTVRRTTGACGHSPPGFASAALRSNCPTTETRMHDQRQDAFYMVAVTGDGLVLARRVSPGALEVPEIGRPLIGYLGDDTPSRTQATSWALSVLLTRDD
jgi:hypothetical protein